MKDDTIEDKNDLIKLIEDAGWSVSRVETTEREYKRHDEHEVTDVTIEIVVSKEYERGFESPYRVK